MKLTWSRSFALSMCVFLLAALPGSGEPSEPEVVEISIQASPSTLLLDWKTRGDPRITVHAEVSFSLFDSADIQVWLDGIQATYLKADARGDLVAKFDREQIADLLRESEQEVATLSLRAVTRTGTVYVGEDEVRVVGS